MSADPTQQPQPGDKARPLRLPSEVPAWQQASHAKRSAHAARPAPASPWALLRAWRLPPLPAQARSGQGYLGAHWRGELDLLRSFWLNHLLLLVPLSYALSAAMAALQWRGQALQIGALAMLLGWPALMALAVWSAVGLWRASQRWLGTNQAPLWAWLARLGLLLTSLQLLVSLGFGVLPQLGNWFSLARGVDPLGRASIELSDDGLHLQLRGVIGLGDAERLRTALDGAPDLRRLELVSSGGRLHEAELMAALLRTRGLTTRAIGQCVDACVPLFLAGTVRQLNPGAQLGLRRLSGGSFHPLVELQLSRVQARQLRAWGLTPYLVELAMLTRPPQVWTPPIEELLANGLVSPLPQTLALPLPPGASAPLADFVDAIRIHPVWQALERRLPGTANALARRLQAERASGASDDTLQALAWSQIAPQMPAVVNGVDTLLRRRYVQLVLAQLKALRGLSAADGGAAPCRDLLDGRVSARALLPAALQVKEAAWLIDAADAPLVRFAERAPKPVELEVVRRSVGAGAPGVLAGLWGGPRVGAGPDCAVVIGLIERTVAQTPARRDLAERLLFQRP